MKYSIAFVVGFLFLVSIHSQELPDSCKLDFGTNLDGLVDWSTELPFVDLMHNSREWYTKDSQNPNSEWDTENASELSYRPDGYPTHIPQVIPSTAWEQTASTIWAVTSGWEIGEYTILWDGTGTIELFGGASNITLVNSHKITFDFNLPIDNILELTILTSDIEDPLHNIRVLMPGTELTYEEQPFNPNWIDRLSVFKNVRFMDWAYTNHWGQPDEYTWEDTTLFDWNERAQLDYYTWTTNKGIPYEMMIQLLNDYDMNGWVCVPHRASNDYIENMALLFKENLEPGRILTVEYSNEIWNWIFGQAQWLYTYGCEQTGTDWPEGIVPYIQNCLDIWTNVYAGELDRIVRVVGVQSAWQDVSNRIVFNMTPGSFDDIAPAFYFGLSEEGDAALDALGSSATISDVAFWVRQQMDGEFGYIESQKASIVDSIGVGMSFYEGGQHITSMPFGDESTYDQALLDIQRDTSMYNMYNEWFEKLRTIDNNNQPLKLMHFSFVGDRSAQYGSWGMLESISQDTALIPAPKYAAIMDNLNTNCFPVGIQEYISGNSITVYPNPTTGTIAITGLPDRKTNTIQIFNVLGEKIKSYKNIVTDPKYITLPKEAGIYFIIIHNNSGEEVFKIIKR